ncbi:hypothetical protein D1AOALGA4SA_12642 [Olavius algarvensis Delta 1 endosymbiont]|nr:hypothetical protein D1AOALGA4SA_12642 [Olavius algarvensis Delta 1 endosymbiont]
MQTAQYTKHSKAKKMVYFTFSCLSCFSWLVHKIFDFQFKRPGYRACA